MDRIYSYNEKEVNFSSIDQHANSATRNDSRTFDTLVTYLKRFIQDGAKGHAQLYLARGLLAWIGHAQTALDSNARYNTPMNLVVEMVNSRVSHADVYATFCRYADIDCKVVVGRSKAIRYRAGDCDSGYLQGHTWNIITADGHDHLVHPNWAVQAIIGYAHGGEMMVEADGKASVKMQSERKGRAQYVFNNFWFCTHPKVFVTRCLPDDPGNQLLPADDRVNSVDEFLGFPDLRQAFYTSGLSLMSETSCRLKSNQGRCAIQLLTNNTKPNALNFSYELSLINADNVGLKASDLPLLVLFTRNRDVFEFEVRFPSTGEYRFKIKLHDEDTDRIYSCCEFRIDCGEVDKNCKRLPADSGIEGYGYGPSAEVAGLKHPSEPSGKLYVEPSTSKKGKDNQNRSLKFKLDDECADKKEFVTTVYSVDGRGKTVSHPDKSKAVVDPDTLEMTIGLTINEPGEYSLVLSTKDKIGGKKAESTPVLRYLVSTDKEVNEQRLKIKLQKREIKKQNKMAAKETEKVTLMSEYDSLQTEVDEKGLIDP